MKAIVVGGGITGCVISSFLSNYNFEVDLYEASSQLGGILKDIIFDKISFYNDCQYLEPDSQWLNELSNETQLEIRHFLHRYASWTSLTEETVFNTKFAGPVFNYRLNLEEQRKIVKKCNSLSFDSTLQERFECYPSSISNSLENWVKCQLGIAPSELNNMSAVGLQISRIYLKGDESNLYELKSTFNKVDDLFGLPRSYFGMDNSSFKASLPAKGYNNLFENFSKLLIKKNVNLFISNSVRCRVDADQIKFLCQSGEINHFDLMVWAANPTQLIKIINKGKIENYIDSSHTYIFKIDFNQNSKLVDLLPFYIQVFSLDSPIRRIYIYTNTDGEVVVSVEVFNVPNIQTKNIRDYTINILEKMFNFSNLKFITSVVHHRKTLITNSELVKITHLHDYLTKNQDTLRIIDGGWHIYGRGDRIEYVKNKTVDLLSTLCNRESFL